MRAASLASKHLGPKVLSARNFSAFGDKKRGALVMQDGTVFEGTHFGADRSLAGQLVFSTNMTGYPESMTDPSFTVSNTTRRALDTHAWTLTNTSREH